MSIWKLYWVMSDGYEDCFVVAKNSISARHVDASMNGMDLNDTSAFIIRSIPDELENEANKRYIEWSKINASEQVNKTLKTWPYYADDWVLDYIGAKRRTIDDEEQILINDYVFCRNKNGEAHY